MRTQLLQIDGRMGKCWCLGAEVGRDGPSSSVFVRIVVMNRVTSHPNGW